MVEVSSGRSWCLSGWDCHGCQSCVLLRVGRLVTGQYILDGKVVGKVRLVGTVYLVDWLDGQCGQVGQLVEVSSGRSWCLSGWDGHVCQSCVSLRVGRLVTDQYYLGGKVVEKVRLVGAVYLVDWLDGQYGQVGQVVGILESCCQDGTSKTG